MDMSDPCHHEKVKWVNGETQVIEQIGESIVGVKLSIWGVSMWGFIVQIVQCNFLNFFFCLENFPSDSWEKFLSQLP